ncbi:MAG: Serine hydroxymethyltransferase [uncultured bacterium (gcode 4)]|uniref:Serine hydroxymethyltransferase n=1 Tax=uncultured bacterium (gcode 4) TaxID=1234023 RepID=K2GFP1_9BACT|nr:MAG: Serine hydroxymethyltransferase [uncultured bacterium (gcode 4)]
MKNLALSDPELYLHILNEEKRQENEIELIASENYASMAVLEAAWSILTNKYSEWYPWKRYYAWQINIDEIENLAIKRAKEIFGAEYINVQPLSGSPANLAVFLWVLKPWDTILWMSLDQGWHLSHWHPLNFSWILYNIIWYTVDKWNEMIDMDEVERLAIENKPKMIIAWFSAYSRNLDWKRFREIADNAGSILMADISHIAWLIAWGVLENPVPYCDIVTTTTHKTLRWPRWAIIMSKESFGPAIARAVFPWVQWWPHENLIAAKAVAFKEAQQDEFKAYSRQIVDNARQLSESLSSYWFRIVSGWTDNHLMLVDVYTSFWISWKEAEIALEKIGISCNKNMIPYDVRKPLDPSWIRLWTPAVTTRWMKEEEMKLIAFYVYQAIHNKDNEDILKWLKEDVKELCIKFPIYNKKICD